MFGFSSPALLPGALRDGRTPVFVEVGADPRVSPGLDLPIGSLAKWGSIFLEKGDSNATTNWVRLGIVGRATTDGDVQTLSVSGLTGNVDRYYEGILTANVTNYAGSGHLLYFNGAVGTTEYTYELAEWYASTSTSYYGSNGGTAFVGICNIHSSGWAQTRFRFDVRDGFPKSVQWHTGGATGGWNDLAIAQGRYNAPNTQITQITVSTNHATERYGAGSELILWCPREGAR